MAEGRVYGNLGNVHCAMGHFNKAVKLHEQVIFNYVPWAILTRLSSFMNRLFSIKCHGPF